MTTFKSRLMDSRLERIVLTYRSRGLDMGVFLLIESTESQILEVIEKYSETHIRFSTTSYRQLNRRTFQCRENDGEWDERLFYKNNGLHKNSYHCIVRELNNTFNCLPLMGVEYIISIEQHLQYSGYKFCANYMDSVNQTVMSEI